MLLSLEALEEILKNAKEIEGEAGTVFFTLDGKILNISAMPQEEKEERWTPNADERLEARDLSKRLVHAFPWCRTEEGFDYWEEVKTKLMDLSRTENLND